jgi:hypothetical protein
MQPLFQITPIACWLLMNLKAQTVMILVTDKAFLMAWLGELRNEANREVLAALTRFESEAECDDSFAWARCLLLWKGAFLNTNTLTCCSMWRLAGPLLAQVRLGFNAAVTSFGKTEI